MARCFWFCLGLIPFLVAAKPEKRNFRFFIDEIGIKPVAKDLFEDINISVRQLNNRSFVNGNVILRRNIDQFEVDVSVDILKLNKQIMHLFKLRVDLCQLFTTVHKSRVLRIYAKTLSIGMNGNKRCPIISHFNYTLSNWYMAENDYPSYIPEGQIKCLSKYYSQNQLILRMKTLASVIYNKAVENYKYIGTDIERRIIIFMKEKLLARV